MPVENLEEEGLPNNPNLKIAQWKFIICNPDGVNKEQAKKNIMAAVKEKGIKRCCVIFYSLTRNHRENKSLF